MNRVIPLLWVVLQLGAGSVLARQGLPLTEPYAVPGVTYRTDVPAPQDVLGHVIGERHTRPHEIVEYVRAVGAASDRVIVGEYGRTVEHRPLLFAVVTSPANHARLEALRQANLRLSEDPDHLTDAELEGMPVMVEMHYSVHGNEASGSEAALLTLYHLAAGEGAPVQRVLDSAIVVIDPLINPDGRDRFVDWVNGNRGGVHTTDSSDREHIEPWPGGRTNHYWFDLNRDWLPAQLPESQGRLDLFHRWRPQVLIDAHEMGGESTFFFQPGIPSRNNPNTPASTVALTAELARYHATELDRIGSLYYSGASYDDFFYGKGSTYPDINGAVGVLFEQGSSRALARETKTGVLTFGATIRNQVAASMSTLAGAIGLRKRLLRNMREFYRSAPRVASEQQARSYVVCLNEGRTRAQAFVEMLLRHRIQVFELAGTVNAGGETLGPGDGYVIPVRQPQTRLLKTLMERVTTFEDSLFYDISTWTMPLAFGIHVETLQRERPEIQGRRIEQEVFDGGKLEGGPSAYAYVMRWNRYFAPRALYRMMEAGLKPRVALRPFELEANGHRMVFDRGSVILPVRGRNEVAQPTPDQLFELVGEVVEQDHVEIVSVSSGLTPIGDDFGFMSLVSRPEIAVLTGSPISASSAGEVWHLLSDRFEIPVSLLDVGTLKAGSLDRYSTLVMPAGAHEGLGTGTANAVTDWVRRGGVLIALESSVRWAIDAGLVDEAMKPESVDSVRVPYEDVSARRGAREISGSILEASFDLSHPLAFGLEPTVPLFRTNEIVLEPSRSNGVDAAVYSAAPVLSGYVPKNLRAALPGTPAVVAEKVGDGTVILLLDNPNFRAFWYGSNRLFLNAVFFGGLL